MLLFDSVPRFVFLANVLAACPFAFFQQGFDRSLLLLRQLDLRCTPPTLSQHQPQADGHRRPAVRAGA
jgi:hypothetical protein